MSEEGLLAGLPDDLRAYFQREHLPSITSLTVKPVSGDRALFVCDVCKGKRLLGHFRGLAGYENGAFFVAGLHFTEKGR